MPKKSGTKQAFQIRAKSLGPGKASEQDTYKLQALLARYGYLSGTYAPGTYDQATKDAVSQFQSFYGIYPDQDGVCDSETTALLNRPRCGLPDPDPGDRSPTGRLAPFVTVGARWPDNALSYRFLNATPDIPAARQRRIIREAFERWAAVSALGFREAAQTESPTIPVAFHRGSHGDGFPFDDGGGPDGNTLAHAFFPPPAGGSWAGSLHFDEFEAWKDAPGGAGTRLYNVALHEIGHVLGLAHSQDDTAIMYAYYAEDRNDLRPDDVSGIQSLYGSAEGAPVAISLGERVSGRMGRTGAEAHYQLTLENKLLVQLNGPPEEDFDVYVRYGRPAGTNDGEYDAVSYGVTSDELVTVGDPRAGTYYILVHSYRGSGSYELEVDVS